MEGYLSWNKKTITDCSEENISKLYDEGFVFTRLGKGMMTQTRSVRIDLKKFEPTSENRRVLKKTDGLEMKIVRLPHPDYDWRIHKMGFDFYTRKFGKDAFSANKIKELLTSENSNFNLLLEYRLSGGVIPSVARNPLKSAERRDPSASLRSAQDDKTTVGYAICFANKTYLHYAYPFYDLDAGIPNLGISMMTKAIIWAKETGKKFVCLGSAQNKAAVYKLQFSGVEWFDGKNWQTDLAELKKIL